VSVEFDSAQQSAWHATMEQFSDASIFQTWDYVAPKYGSNHLTNFVARKHGDIVAAALGGIVRIPRLPVGIAHFPWGPMWRVRGAELDLDGLRQALRAAFRQYAVKRGLLVRLRSHELHAGSETDAEHLISAVFRNEGFEPAQEPHYRTVRLDLSRPLEALRADLRPSWRRHLLAAEKKGFSVIRGTGPELFEMFERTYHAMRSRKQLTGYQPDIRMYRAAQQNLPAPLRPVIMICQDAGEPIAATVVSAMGDSGRYILGATSDRAIRMNLRGSYLLHWETIKWLKAEGFHWYDLRGYNPKSYPGVSRFKTGFNGVIVSYIEFVACRNWLSLAAVGWGEALVRLARATRRALTGRVK